MKIERAMRLKSGDPVRLPKDRGTPATRGTVLAIGENVYLTPYGEEYVWIHIKGGGVWPSNRVGE